MIKRCLACCLVFALFFCFVTPVFAETESSESSSSMASSQPESTIESSSSSEQTSSSLESSSSQLSSTVASSSQQSFQNSTTTSILDRSSSQKEPVSNSGGFDGFENQDEAGFHWDDQMTAALNRASTWLGLNEKDETYLIVTGVCGTTTDVATATKMKQKIVERNGEYHQAFLLEQDILSLVFSGLNPKDFQGLDLIQVLYQYPDLPTEGVYSMAFALIAYDSNDYSLSRNARNSRKRLVNWLLESQNEDGSFGMPGSEIRDTATVLTALSNYVDQKEVSDAVRKGLVYLQDTQNKDGDFLQDGIAYSDNLSYVMIALNSLGISVNDSRFAQNHQNLMDRLLAYQGSDGGFSVQIGEESTVRSTGQAILAMVATQHQINPYIQQNNLNYQSSSEGQSDGMSIQWIIAVVVAVLMIVGIVAVIYNRKKKLRKLQQLETEKEETKK